MILLRNVHKRYQTDHGLGPWVLKGVTLDIPKNVNVGLIGGNGAGKSTLLRLIAGVDQPTKGTVERHCRVSWPMGLGSGFQANLTGRQNAKFICRVLGHDADMAERVAYVESFADIGAAFDEQVRNYSSGMRSRLTFALSLAFEFDVYISDEVTAAGDSVFRQKAATAFKRMVNKSGLIMVSHGESTLRQFCQAGIFLQNGQAHWFDNIEDALNAYKASTRKAMQSAGASPEDLAEFEPVKKQLPMKKQAPVQKVLQSQRMHQAQKANRQAAAARRMAERSLQQADAAKPAPGANKLGNKQGMQAGPAALLTPEERKARRARKNARLRNAQATPGADVRTAPPAKALGRARPLRKSLQSNPPLAGTKLLGRKKKVSQA